MTSGFRIVYGTSKNGLVHNTQVGEVFPCPYLSKRNRWAAYDYRTRER